MPPLVHFSPRIDPTFPSNTTCPQQLDMASSSYRPKIQTVSKLWYWSVDSSQRLSVGKPLSWMHTAVLLELMISMSRAVWFWYEAAYDTICGFVITVCWSNYDLSSAILFERCATFGVNGRDQKSALTFLSKSPLATSATHLCSTRILVHQCVNHRVVFVGIVLTFCLPLSDVDKWSIWNLVK